MSRNVSRSPSLRTPARKPDRRIRHTRETLGDALVKLMHEKPFEEITVQHILDRAGVSRSTFYTHFSDKNDLFLSDAEEFFEMAAFALSRRKDNSRRIAPVREMFTHLAEWRPFFDAMVAAGSAAFSRMPKRCRTIGFCVTSVNVVMAPISRPLPVERIPRSSATP